MTNSLNIQTETKPQQQANLNNDILLKVEDVSYYYGKRLGCKNISFDLYPGEVIGIVGESGSGKSTLLNLLSSKFKPTTGKIIYSNGMEEYDINALSEHIKRALLRTEWGFVHQNPRDGLRMQVSAGGNIGERLMACGNRHYGNIRKTALNWLERVEIAADRVDDTPKSYSGGMQQRLQIARNLVSNPRLVFMDEPTGGLDVSVQAKILDLLRNLVRDMNLSVVLVTHDLAVARLLAHRLIVMRKGEVIESGLSDQVLDDPHHEYTQLLVSSILQG
ncbi:phosphonate C-P lyase system protein PhnK [Desulfovibrio litoralis]|uniref:Putative phosphonate transport system ATP-binding protein n=1 Tax=Desulfovibrio litoralis DSM 11393 TaxID=1121455 RepID=A0A1M7SSK2_9BACT|nr:phosphonate C-P lyase system protein PhnK [Desulfovibrio litoralis]SHN61533.1 putative phosphonate transport system ATP-binding protein [Desulfovibrio litoralis DSM 11393]